MWFYRQNLQNSYVCWNLKFKSHDETFAMQNKMFKLYTFIVYTSQNLLAIVKVKENNCQPGSVKQIKLRAE